MVKNIQGLVIVFVIMLCSHCIRKPVNGPVFSESEMEWIYVKGGTFQMGVKDSEKAGLHEVTLSSFFIGKYEVTNTQYAEFLNRYDSDTVKTGPHQGEKIVYSYRWGLVHEDSLWKSRPGYEDFPTLNVPWIGAVTFCAYYGWRLPTEAEWEYAASGGQKTRGHVYAGSDSIDVVGWTHSNSLNQSHPVGLLQPNELGIYDMTGNVWEWVYDWYAPYSLEPQTNPTGPESGPGRVYRGGAWLSADYNSHNRLRCGGGVDYHGISHNGFRCVTERSALE